MAQKGACGGRPVAIDDVYEHDEVTHNAQLKAFFQRIEEWFNALSKQHAYAASVGIRTRLGSYHGTKRSMWGKTCCHR